MSQHTDQYYIDKTMQGDTRAFAILVERYQDLVFTVIVRILKVREEAEEIAQDTFIKAFSALKSYRGESKFSTWLYRIAYRKALDRLRQNKRQFAGTLDEEKTESSFEVVEDALHYLEEKEREATVRGCIMKLPAQEAAIITLYYYEEQSVKEISAITGLSEDNIKIRLYRSRKKLFNLMKHYVLPEITNTNGKAI